MSDDRRSYFMYEIIDKDKRKEYTFEELQQKFDGKWLYLVNSEFSDENFLLYGIPVIIADSHYEGFDGGIYDEFGGDEFGEVVDLDFTRLMIDVMSVFLTRYIGLENETNE